MQLSDTARSDACDAITALLDGGTLKFYTGTQPTDISDDPAGTLLATVTLASPSFGDAASGVCSIEPTETVLAVANGTATWARFADSAGNTVMDVSVGTTSSEELVFDDVSFVTGGEVAITSLTITVPGS